MDPNSCYISLENYFPHVRNDIVLIIILMMTVSASHCPVTMYTASPSANYDQCVSDYSRDRSRLDDDRLGCLLANVCHGAWRLPIREKLEFTVGIFEF